MSDVFDLFKNDYLKPENLLNASAPLTEVAGRAHRAAFKAFDSTARANLSLAEDLLDLTAERLEALYGVDTLSAMAGVQKDGAMQAGERLAAWGEELRDVMTAYQASWTDLAADAIKPRAAKPAPAAKSAKAA